MFINFITPCTRIFNLKKIAKSINIPKSNFRWIIVIDKKYILTFSISKFHIIVYINKKYLPTFYILLANCEIFTHKDKESVFGNSQRNFAIDKTMTGYDYFLDDDNEIHPDFWNHVKNRTEEFIHFQQEYNGTVRFGKEIEIGSIDSSSFIVSHSLAKLIKWDIEKYEADGIFAKKCKNLAKTSIYLSKPICYYNSLRVSK